MLPKVDGFAVLELIRKESLVPVLMVTAKDSVEDQVRGFHLQADDYIPKPFITLLASSLSHLYVIFMENHKEKTCCQAFFLTTGFSSYQ